MAVKVTYYNLKQPIIESLIEECNVGEFKLTDDKFNLALEEYEMEDQTVMDLMVKVPRERGEFLRVSDGWLFIEK